jgi:3-phosphoshikimate 1-carboxyvinyltransferase
MITEKESILIQPFVNPCRAVVKVPGSKSISNRALILSVMCKGEVELNGLLQSEDVDLMQQALLHLGVNIQKNGNNIKVFGNGGLIKCG